MIAPAPPTIQAVQLLKQLGALRENTPLYLLGVARAYGDFVRFEVGGVTAVLLNHPEFIKHVLQENHRNYSKDTIQYNSLSRITGQGLLTSDGEAWFAHRKLQQPAFARPRLAELDRVVLPATEGMLARWQAAALNGDTVDVDAEMMRLALTVVGKALFSIDLAEEAKELTQATMHALDHIIYLTRNPLSAPGWVPTAENRRFKQALGRLDGAVYSLMDACRKSADQPDDLLGMLLRAQPSLTDRQVRDELITMLVAGHETVASALTWCWYLLARNPAVWQTLRAEVQQVLGSRMPATADLPALPFTNQVFTEALRLYPPAWLITRKALAADTVGGYNIPAGALVILSPYAMHRHPAFWENPESFNPTRFAPAADAARPRYAFIPFGGGPRLCIGSNFALTEAGLILAVVSQRFRLELAPGQAVHMDALVTLRPRGGLRMKPHLVE